MRTSSIFSISLQLFSTNAFTPAILNVSPLHFYTKTHLHAESGPPQYKKSDAVLQQAEVLAEGTVLLHVITDEKIDYRPGHVLALEIESDDTSKDGDNEKEWMRGPYTVSRATENSFDVMIKVVGEKTKHFASAPAGTPLRFGGKFKVPILEGIRKEETERVVFICTGVGAGPCIGAIEEALGDTTFPPIELYSSYRTSDEVVYSDHLNELKLQNPERFMWSPIISSEGGRISGSEVNLQAIVATTPLELNDTHYHLIGNGQMVGEFKEGLAKAGVPDEKVTIEMYFNHKANINDDVVSRIANMISASTGVEA